MGNTNKKQFIKIHMKYYENYIDLIKNHKEHSVSYTDNYKYNEFVDFNYNNFRIVIGKNVDNIIDQPDKKNIIIKLINNTDLIKAIKKPILFEIDAKQFDVCVKFVDREIYNTNFKINVDYFYSTIVLPSYSSSKLIFMKPLTDKITINKIININLNTTITHKLCFKNGLLHNKWGPAYIFTEKNRKKIYKSHKYYYINGLVHKINNPAIICKETTTLTEIHVNNGYVSSYNNKPAYSVNEMETYYDSETDEAVNSYRTIEELYAKNGHIHNNLTQNAYELTNRKAYTVKSMKIDNGKIKSLYDAYNTLYYTFVDPNNYTAKQYYCSNPYEMKVVDGVCVYITK